MIKIIRAVTASRSLGFVEGMLPDLMKKYEVILVSSPGEQMDEITSDAPAVEAPSVEAAPVRRAVRRKGIRMVKVNGVMKPYIYYYTEYV